LNNQLLVQLMVSDNTAAGGEVAFCLSNSPASQCPGPTCILQDYNHNRILE